MAKLPKFTLSFDRQKQNWKLENDKSDKVVKRFDTKEEATVGGVLSKAVSNNGSVKIEKKKGGFEEKRTFPRSKDPRESKG